MDRLSGCLTWKTVGKTVGWIGLAMNIALATFFMSLFWLLNGEGFLAFTLLIFLLNLVASIIWLRGIAKKKKTLMLASLLWWAIPLSIWGGFMLFVIFEGIFGMLDGRQPFLLRDYLVFGLTAFCLTIYFIAVWSYEPIKESFKRTDSQRLDVTLAALSENKELVQRCGCGPNCDCCKV